MANVSVDVNASFDSEGKIKPRYVWILDKNHNKKMYQILRILRNEEEIFSGIRSCLYYCEIEEEKEIKEIKLRYYCVAHKWALLK